jgi:O-antigen ligase
MFTGENRAIAERNTLNAATIGIFAAHPILGVGLGTVPLAMRAAYPSFPFDYQPAHFVLLDVAAETGFVGALIYLAAMLSPWIALWLNRRRINFTPALVGISGVLVAVTIVGFFDYYTWLLVPGRLWQWLAWGLWGAVYTSPILGAADA